MRSKVFCNLDLVVQMVSSNLRSYTYRKIQAFEERRTVQPQCAPPVFGKNEIFRGQSVGGVYRTTHEAQLAVEDCEHDDFMLQAAGSLVNAAVEAHMRSHKLTDNRRATALEKQPTSR